MLLPTDSDQPPLTQQVTTPQIQNRIKSGVKLLAEIIGTSHAVPPMRKYNSYTKCMKFDQRQHCPAPETSWTCASLWCHRTMYPGTMQISELFGSQRDFISQKEPLGKICPVKSILQILGREKNTSIKPEQS